jgi:hypothetical protein
MGEEGEAANAGEARIGIREMLSNVPRRDGAQERVAEGMTNHIRIRMAEQPCFPRKLHSRQDQRTVLGEPVRVESYPGTHLHFPVGLLPASSQGLFRPDQILRRGNFYITLFPGYYSHAMAYLLDQGGVISVGGSGRGRLVGL